MIFTSYDFLVFLGVVFAVYWSVPNRRLQNVLLLVASYLFYGWIHPWFCWLVATSTVVDYACGLAMRRPGRRKPWLVLSLVVNLGMLGFFKYFGFFVDSTQRALASIGLEVEPVMLEIFLPVGISFYTFQTLSYTIDVYRGLLEPRRDFFDFALFVVFFPQLVAGPIERARRFLPQIEAPRRWSGDNVAEAASLLIRGFVKKLVVADNVAVVVNKIFLLEDPSIWLLAVGGFAFAMQVYGDFSGYTDIARGSAKLLGFDLVENFRAPYLAVSPSDLWRRWHISFSSWIRDYLYIPLGGSRARGYRFFFVVLASMGLSGLWHGAAWHFVAWGLFHGVLVIVYHRIGLGGRWEPSGLARRVLAVSIMFSFSVTGYTLFRAPSMGWWFGAVTSVGSGVSADQWVAGLSALGIVLLYSLFLLGVGLIERVRERRQALGALLDGVALVALVLLAHDGRVDFIYFQF